MKTVLLILTSSISILSNQSYAQNHSASNSSIEVMRSVINFTSTELVDNKIIYINNKTTLHDIAKINFNNFDIQQTVPNQPALDNSWLFFLKSIDTTKIANYDINVEKIKSNNSKLILKRHEHGTPLITFSPVVFSNDGELAVCTLGYYGGPENSSASVIFLHRINNKWKVFTLYRLYLS